MADTVPVCDVLCEAMEYLSKLGSNLRNRSENLREKKIRRDRLKNTHAVQKVAKKVLLICELSKKSLDNVETGVKNLLSQIDLTQASTSSGGKSRPPNESVSYEYIEYASRRLKIREKICLNHYTSVKVVVKSMPHNMLKEYPVYHDCKLYRMQKEKRKPEKAIGGIENFDDSDCEIQKIINFIENSQSDDDKNHKKISQCPQKVTTDCFNLSSTSTEKEESTEKANLECNNLVRDKNESTNSDQSSENSKSENKNKDEILNRNKPSDDTHEISKGDKSKEFLESSNSIISQNSPRNLSNGEEPINCSNNENDIENSMDNIHNNNVDNTSSNSNESKKSFLKCVNINKLLETTSKEENNLTINKDSTTTAMKVHNKATAISKKEKRKKYKRISKHSSSSDDSSFDSDIEKKRKALKLFKPKEFVITVQRLPNFSVNFLKVEGLNKITQNGLIVCDIQSSLANPKEIEIARENCLKEVSENCAEAITENRPRLQETIEPCEETSNNKILKENVMNDSDSDKSLNRATDKDLLDVAESVRNALMHGSDSDRQSEFENISSSAVPACNDNETAHEKEDTTVVESSLCNQPVFDENLEKNREASLLNSSSEDNDTKLPNTMEVEAPTKDADDDVALSLQSSQDPEKTNLKSAMEVEAPTEDADDDIALSLQSSQDPEKTRLQNAMEVETPTKDADDDIALSLQSSQDPEKVKLSLLNDSSDSSVSNQKTKMNVNKDDNNRNNEDPEKIKSQLLHDSSDNTPDEPLKQSQESEKESSRKARRKRIMENMYAKKMLLTNSSSSDTDDEELRNALKYVRKSFLQETAADRGKQCITIRPHKNSDSDSENIVAEVVQTKRTKRKASLSDDDLKLTLRIKKRAKSEANNSGTEDNEESYSGSSKMGRSRAKRGSSSSQNSDSQDANDKDIDGLTNLSSLNKVRRRRSSTYRAAETCDSNPSGEEMPKAPRIKAEALLKSETSSDAVSIAGSEDGEEAEELPTVVMASINGDGISHLAKDDLLEESDSSASDNHNTQEDSKKSESEEETVKSKRRGKGAAISSDSEAGASRKAGRGRRLSDFEDSEDDGSSEPGKKRRKKKDSDSDGDGSDSGKKRRRRIKNVDDSEASDSDTENEGRNKHGRKNIRKVMGKNQLEEATKKAAREEKERIARIAERQKVYNNLEFDESGKPDEVILEKVVLDFDPETKEPLIEVDRGLVKKLKPHQANGIKFMWDACFESVKRIKKDKGSGCILAHCMGLGKTLQVVSLTHTLLTHGDLTSVKRVLVVCPLSTVLNWVNEFRIWLKHAERDYEVDVYEISKYKQNSERAFHLQQWFECGGVCVLGYEMFRNLSADNPKKFKKKMLKNFQESLVDPGPDLVVCDEGHLLKNEKTSLSQSMNKVKTLRRIVLTGTPLQNNLKEYYCMVQFVKPNLLGKYNEYLNRFVNPITNGQYTDSTEHDIKVMKRRSHVLHKMLDGAVQRRDYGVLAPFLPPKHEYVLFITLTEVQIKLYQHYLDNYSRRPLPGKSSGFLFPDFQSLQRIWTHPLVLKYNSERYEIMQQKKREREEEDSEGSLVDFIDDDSTPDESSTEESSDDCSDMSDDSRKKSKKKKAAKKGKAKDSKISTRRGTRANPVEQLEEEEKPLESLESKYENPTEWWIKLMNEDELEDMRNSHKLVLLFDILRQCEAIGDKLLVFSQSLYSLDLIEHFLGKVDEATQEGRMDEKLGGHVGSWSPGIDYFRLDGSTSCENRSIWCKNFNREDNPRARLFLISTRAGGLGINLVAANRVVIFDVSWNPSHDVQSIFRVYRFGQKKPCYIYRFLAMGTMEEKIYERQVTKQAISKRVIDEQQIDRHYAENDLAELYKFEPRPPTPRPLPPLPKDRLFAEMLREHDAQIYKYHEHDSLLENKEEETLSEEERKAAWEDFENEKNRPPPAPFANAWPMPNGMVPGLLQQQQLAYATLGAMLRKDIPPNINDSQIREMLLYSNQMMQKMNSDMYKYPQSGMMNNAALNSYINSAGGGAGAMGGSSGLQYDPPWQRQQQQQQQMRMQQLMQQQQQHQNLGPKLYAGGLGSRDPIAMAIQQQRTREMMLGERAGARPRGRPPLQRNPPPSDVVNLADSD